jgi:hypothetical protein
VINNACYQRKLLKTIECEKTLQIFVKIAEIKTSSVMQKKNMF